MRYLKSLMFLIVITSVLTGCANSVVNGIINATDVVKNSMNIKDEELNKSGVFLKLDNNKHNDIIKDVAITKNKEYLISAGMDSDIRIWDLKSGKMLEKLSSYIGIDGTSGKILALSLSNDNKYLAVAGNFAKSTQDYKGLFSNDIKASNAIRIYDFKKRKLIKVLKYHNNIIEAIRFSEDNKILVSGSNDSNIAIWDVKQNFKLIKKITNNNFGVTDIKLIQKENKKYEIISSTIGGEITLYNYDLNKNISKILKSYSLGGYMIDIGTSSKYIAVSFISSRDIALFDRNLNFIKKLAVPKTKDSISSFAGAAGISFTPDNKYLVHGGDALYIYNVKNDFKLLKRIKDNTNNTIATGVALRVLDNNRILYTEKDIRIYDIRKKGIIKRLNSRREIVQSIGINGSKIAYGFKNYKKDKFHPSISGPLSKYFDLEYKKHGSLYNDKEFHRIKYKNGEYELTNSKGGYQLNLYKNDRLESNLNYFNYGITGRRHNSFGFHKELVFSANKQINFYNYNLSIKPITQLVGHVTDIQSVAIEKNRLISVALNNVIKIWDISNVGKTENIYPLVSLYITPNNEWVMWTPEGYFNSSENGYKYIGFHINQGYDKEAKWVGIEKLYDHFYRPDLVELALDGKDITPYTNGLTYKDVLKNPAPEVRITKVNHKKINKNRVTHYKDKISLNFDVKSVDSGGVGLIRVYQEGKLVKTIGDGKINRTVANVDEQLETEELTKKAKKEQDKYLASLENIATKSINGTIKEEELIQNVNINTSIDNSGSHKIILPLKAGKNKIEIEAFNKTNTVASIRKKFVVNAKIKRRKPIVYAIVAGVNKFEKTGILKNLKYSENDAKTIRNILKLKIREKVVPTLLLGKDFTKENLEEAIEKIKSKARLEDKIVFYVSTHGKTYKGDLFLVPQNNKRAKNWIRFEDIFKKIQSISALEQIFVVDACESGKAKDIVSSIYDSKASVLAKQSGVHVLLATAKGTFAFEHPDPKVKHGVFTNNILKALNSRKTDKNRDRKISVIELSKVLRSPEYVTDYQYPVIRNVGQDTKIRDF